MTSFRKLIKSTLVAVYFLILVGGIVRSSGSGMGCPDWPTCFGQWVPPTSVDQLPKNYKETYAEYRHKKNQRFAEYLRVLGFGDTANKIMADESIRVEADFNPLKTWIEYVNRLVGVIIGFLIFLVFIFSWRYRKTDSKLTVLAFSTFLLVGFQGWIGSFVVSTNLTPWTITFHMFLALVLVALLIYLMHLTQEQKMDVYHSDGGMVMRVLLISCALVLAVQILFGTQVREEIDLIAAEIPIRENWIAALGMKFIIHRSFSWLVLIFHAILMVKLWKMSGANRFALTIILLILGTILTGAGMAWFAVPPVLQPVHLLLATITFGMQFLLMLRINQNVPN